MNGRHESGGDAMDVGGARKVVIDPLSRVEGHGKVSLQLDESGRVCSARLHIVEFRGFEVFIRGRPYWEVPVMVQRLCGICPVSHHLAASKALDAVVGAHTVTPSATALRRLMHYGQILQSHALHFFYLASPDLVFGFDAEPGRRNLFGVAEAFPDIARKGVGLRRFGQEVIRATAGKRIHGTGSVPGGINSHLSAVDRRELRDQLPQVLRWCVDALELVKRLYLVDRPLYRRFGALDANLMSLVRDDGALDLYEGNFRFRDASGAVRFDGLPVADFARAFDEEVKPWSYMKFPYLRELGPERGWYLVGPLARVQNCDFIPTERAERARREFRDEHQGDLARGVLAYHWARMIELLHAAEVIEALLEDDCLEAGELRAGGERGRTGIGVLEAPRGTLIHQYEVGDDDLVVRSNLIVATAHNNQAMNVSIAQVAREYLHGGALDEGLLNRIEVAVRAFDPCLSCATHAVGAMPMAVVLQDAGGAIIDRAVRG